jgi:hypothetical protein
MSSSEKKKRGRKPKNKIVEEIKIPKKRGRKPKIKLTTNIETHISASVENVILSLPIKQNMINELISQDTEPIPFNLNNKDYNLIQNDNINQEKKTYPIKAANIIEVIEKDRNKEIEEFYSNNSLIYIDIYNNNSEFPKKTSVHCFWDMESIENEPYGIPFKKECDKYYMFGIFCSKECAAAYLFDMHIENNVLWERYSLLNFLYAQDNETIKPALPRLCLKKFGGLKTIKEFRGNINKSYNVIMPPMIGIIPLLEEVDLKKSNNITNIEKTNDGLKLKRSKPLPNHKNSLENCMNLTYI